MVVGGCVRGWWGLGVSRSTLASVPDIVNSTTTRTYNVSILDPPSYPRLLIVTYELLIGNSHKITVTMMCDC